MENELKRVLEERKVSGGRFPDFFPFKQQGDELIGEYVQTREWEGRPIYEMKDLKGKEWSVSATVVLRRLLDGMNLQPGDFLIITFEGEGTSKKGRKVKQFSAGKLSGEEAAKLLGREPPEARPAPPTPAAPAPAPPASKPPESKVEPPEEKPTEKPKLSPEKRDEIREFFGKLFEFYEEMKKDEITKRISNRFPDVTLDDVLSICSDFMVYDSAGEVLKKK